MGSRKRQTPGAGVTSTKVANDPGAPVFVENTQYCIDSSNDTLILTSDQGAATINIPHGIYTPAAFGTQFQSSMNADGTLTGGVIIFVVTHDGTVKKYTIDAGSGHTIALTYSGSNAADDFGFSADAGPSQSIISDSDTHAHGTITFDLDENGNGPKVEYAIFNNELSKYVGTGGQVDEASEVWQVADDWDGGGQDARVTVSGLTEYTSYTFKVIARNEAGTPTAFGPSSASMNTLPLIDYDGQSDPELKRITSGNTRIKENGISITGTDGTVTTYDVYVNGTSKAIPFQFKLENYDETVSRVAFRFSEDAGVTWKTAHTFFDIYSGNKTIRFTSDQGGPVDIVLDEATYNTGAAVATNLQTKLNANITLTGGVITFSVTFDIPTGIYTIDSTANHWLSIDYYYSSGAEVFGITDNVTEQKEIISDESRGSAPNTMATSEDGTEHTVYWDSGRDAGKSEEKIDLVKLEVTPYDVSPSGGNAAKIETTESFTVNNRPETVTVQNADGREFCKDTTPVFIWIMANLVLGSHAYWQILIEDKTGVVLNTSSAESVTGWEYEDTPDNWNPVESAGVIGEFIDGVKRARFTVQTPLDVDNDNDYTIIVRQGERRDRGIS